MANWYGIMAKSPRQGDERIGSVPRFLTISFEPTARIVCQRFCSSLIAKKRRTLLAGFYYAEKVR